MLIRNVNIFTEEKEIKHGEILIEGARIKGVKYDGKYSDSTGVACGEVIDGNGCYAIPGMIDLHFHGCAGYDVCDGTKEALDKIARYEASVGVTSICPATMTLSVESLISILKCAADYRNLQRQGKTAGGANFVGINMEGPFISRAKKGAQDEENIIPCNAAVFNEFQKAADGLVKFIGIAPEEGRKEDVKDFIEKVKDCVTVSLAHTNADYETAAAAFSYGAKHAVHLYNAMSGYNHRDPGVVGAVFDSEGVSAEIICDGIHVHPAAVRTAFKMIGAERMILISDSMRAAGMPDGIYTLGGLDVKVEGKKATLVSDNALAGSVTPLPDCFRHCVKNVHIPLEAALSCVTINPAKALGIYDERGSVTVGKMADIVLLNPDLSLRMVILAGSLFK